MVQRQQWRWPHHTTALSSSAAAWRDCELLCQASYSSHQTLSRSRRSLRLAFPGKHAQPAPPAFDGMTRDVSVSPCAPPHTQVCCANTAAALSGPAAGGGGTGPWRPHQAGEHMLGAVENTRCSACRACQRMLAMSSRKATQPAIFFSRCWHACLSADA